MYVYEGCVLDSRERLEMRDLRGDSQLSKYDVLKKCNNPGFNNRTPCIYVLVGSFWTMARD